MFSWEQGSLVSEHPPRLKMQNLLPETAILGESGNGSSFWCVKYISAFVKGGDPQTPFHKACPELVEGGAARSAGGF